jgi:hypothetical protein
MCVTSSSYRMVVSSLLRKNVHVSFSAKKMKFSLVQVYIRISCVCVREGVRKAKEVLYNEVRTKYMLNAMTVRSMNTKYDVQNSMSTI